MLPPKSGIPDCEVFDVEKVTYLWILQICTRSQYDEFAFGKVMYLWADTIGFLRARRSNWIWSRPF